MPIKVGRIKKWKDLPSGRQWLRCIQSDGDGDGDGKYASGVKPEMDDGELGMFAACDLTGTILWIDHRDVEVTEVDGVKPFELLGES